MTPKERAERIATAHYNKPVGNAAQDKADLIAAIEKGMNGVLEEAARICLANACVFELASKQEDESDERLEWLDIMSANSSTLSKEIRALKSPDNSRNTITDNKKD